MKKKKFRKVRAWVVNEDTDIVGWYNEPLFIFSNKEAAKKERKNCKYVKVIPCEIRYRV